MCIKSETRKTDVVGLNVNGEGVGELPIEVIQECISVDRTDAPSIAGRHKRKPIV